jgi:hypothetical protein
LLEGDYFLRQAAALLASAQQTADPQHAAQLLQQAADILAVVNELGAPDKPDTELH